jgi:hypothetical protein
VRSQAAARACGYRYVAPDGRCYVGSTSDIRKRDQRGIDRSNPWLREAFEAHPPETFRFEVLKTLPPGCSEQRMRRAEQRYINKFKSWDPAYGFNIFPACFWRYAGNTGSTRTAPNNFGRII